jgi:hypothetical protein
VAVAFPTATTAGADIVADTTPVTPRADDEIAA